MITVLSGGTGGSKMVDGLARTVGQARLHAIVNTADDMDFYGLRVCPDLDICTYVLAGVVDGRGWGYVEDTFRCLEGLETYGLPAWFGLGDRDLATHIYRTSRLRDGAALHEVAAELAARLGVEARVMPMCDSPVRTRITTATGPKAFQEFLVRDGAAEEILHLDVEGLDAAVPAPGVLEAVRDADAVVIAPSSPIVSIGTILSVPGLRPVLAARRETCVAVSPIIGRAPVEGPAHKFLAGAGHHECSAAYMAEMYADVAATFLLHTSDADEAARVAAADVRPVVTDILMPDPAARARLAAECVAAVGAA